MSPPTIIPLHRSVSCDGETCTLCGQPADLKVGEEIAFDDPYPSRHNLTAYICAACGDRLLRPYLVRTSPPSPSTPTPEVERLQAILRDNADYKDGLIHLISPGANSSEAADLRWLAAALPSLFAAKAATPAWQEITEENFATPRMILVTNHINERGADGRMSHLWLVQMIHRGDAGVGFMGFDTADRKIFGLTHFCPVPMPEPTDA